LGVYQWRCDASGRDTDFTIQRDKAWPHSIRQRDRPAVRPSDGRSLLIAAFRGLLRGLKVGAIMIAILAMALAFGLAIPACANADDPRAKLASLINSADQLYNDAALIVAKQPTTQSAVDVIFDTVGKQWQNDEEAFQDSLAPLQKYSGLPDDLSHGVVRLGQFDSLVFEAVGDVYDCDNPAASADLKIAQEILAHAQMAAKGKPDPKWNPDDLLTNPVDSAACR
jgi:hypothetical protein